ncbi:MAG: TraM recognition domain-containing protein, partial [Patescibacteria group bacterium]
KNYRALKLSRCKNPLISQFWTNAEKTTGEQGLANYVQYVTNKFDVFLSNDIMRPVIAQEKSSWNFRDIMDNKKILLVNLSKGRLGDINANLIGLILVGKILMAALSRVDLFGKDFPPFYLYLDEFQNITTDSIATILSEARKYKLSLNIAHQYIAQLEENISDAVFGNVGSICSFRIGADDAEVLEKQFTPTFSSFDLMNIDNRNAYLKLLVNGKPVKPFNIETLPPPQGDLSKIEMIKELSYQKYGRPREEVEALIMQKYKINPNPTPPLEQGRE